MTCPRCAGDVIQEAETPNDKYRKAYALKCTTCYTLFSMNILLRSEMGRNRA